MYTLNNKIKLGMQRQIQPEVKRTANIACMAKAMLLGLLLVSLSACSPAPENQQQVEASSNKLPTLVIQQQAAQYRMPTCQGDNCTALNLQTIQTQDPWVSQWITQQLTRVLDQQIGENQSLNLQQAVDAYVKKSLSWQHEFNKNKAYQLDLSTQIVMQQQQYVLLNISLDSQQGDTAVQERQYFYVADRGQQKSLSLSDVIEPKQQKRFNKIIQVQYQAWLKAQHSVLQALAPKQLDWQQANWFFDAEGIGLHFRANDLSVNGTAFSIYLNKQQTQKVLQPAIFKQMFATVP